MRVRQPVRGAGDAMTIYAYGLGHGLATILRAALTAKSLRFIWACVSEFRLGELIQNTNQNAMHTRRVSKHERVIQEFQRQCCLLWQQ